jgi:DnaA regulatory inactivator Hda
MAAKSHSQHAQMTLPLEYRPALERDDFLVSEANQEAIAWIDRWPQWPTTALVIHGAAGCGKSHLLHVWCSISKALMVEADQLNEDIVLRAQEPDIKACALDHFALKRLDDAQEEHFFHLFNTMKNKGGTMLIASRFPIELQKLKLPDLASRLKGSPHVEIFAPDDTLLGGVLVKLLRDRGIHISPDVLKYCITHMERSFDSAHNLAQQMDQLSLEQKRKITVPFMKDLFERFAQDGQTDFSF